LTFRVFCFILLSLRAIPIIGQNCDVDFPGTTTINYSNACGLSTLSNITLGKNIFFGNGDVFIFDTSVTASGNVTLDAEGGGTIIIPAGVTVDIRGNLRIESKNSGCTLLNPCVFEIQVEGTLIVGGNLTSTLNTLMWSGDGTVIAESNFEDRGCMSCELLGGCPDFQVIPAKCKDDGDCIGFCTTITASCLLDLVKPVITGCPSDQISNIAGPGCTQAVTWIPPTASDNCAVVSFVASHTPGTVFPKGTTTVTYTATDPAGNSSICSFNITVVDNVAPAMMNCPSDIMAMANASCQAIVSWSAPTFTDNCTGGTMTSTRAPGTTFNLGTTAVTYTATDAAGNTSTCTFNVIVQDAIKPVISGCLSDITVSANASCQAVVSWTPPTFTDNCSGGTITSTRAPGSTFNLGTTAVTYTATDAAGNTSTCTFNVIVQDAIKPLITGCLSDITVNANASCQAVVNWTPPTFTDNCSGTMTSTRAPGSTFNLGTTAVTYTASDAAGNTSTCIFNVIVQDAIKPVISGCPSDITVSANASCQAVVNWTPPTFSDNCSGGTMNSTRTPGTTFNLGATAVTYTASDAAGNTSTCTFNVIVQDAGKPVISGCPSDITVSAGASCQTVVNWTAPTFNDNCSGVTITSTRAPGSTFNVGTTIVTYTATDAVGNTSSCTFNVMVQDVVKPVISGCPSDITVSANASCQAVVTWTPPTFTDNCIGGTMGSTHSAGSTFEAGTTSVTYTATDASGNTVSCSFNVTVVPSDNLDFTNCPDDIFIEIFKGESTAVNWTPPFIDTGCYSVDVTSTHSPGHIFNVGQTNVTYTATTPSGIRTCAFDVTVEFKGIVVHEVVTPNGDGENDTWTIRNIEYFEQNSVVVFDRWGGVVYKANGYNGNSTAWTGDNLPAGTYFYNLIISTNTSNEEYKGFVELVK
jgi:gliding motility-associated-like protein